MSVDSVIRSALSPLGYDAEAGTYTGKDSVYFTYTWQSLGELFADDEPTAERVIAYIHLHAPLSFNVSALCKKTKKALESAGFTWPTLTNLTDANERDVEFVCDIEYGGDLYGDDHNG